MLNIRSSSTSTRQRSVIVGWQLGLGCLAFLVCYIASFALGGEIAAFFLAGLTVLPFALLAVLAYHGSDHTWACFATLFCLFVLAGGYGLTGIAISYDALGDPASRAHGVTTRLLPGGGARLAAVALGMCAAAVVGALGFVPGLRYALSRAVPLDPTSFVHTIALVTVAVFTLMGFVPLLVLNEPPMLAAIAKGSLLGESSSLAPIYSLVWTIPCAIFAVGFGQRRTLREVLARLGLVRPAMRHVLLGGLLSLVLLAAGQLFTLGIDWLWPRLGWPRTDDALVSRLFGGAVLSPAAAVVQALVAGIGEEMTDRGVLQPRLGIVLSSALFTSLHAMQYHWDALLWVFAASLLLGLIRRRTDTTTSVIVHSVFDLVLLLAAVFHLPWVS